MKHMSLMHKLQTSTPKIDWDFVEGVARSMCLSGVTMDSEVGVEVQAVRKRSLKRCWAKVKFDR